MTPEETDALNNVVLKRLLSGDDPKDLIARLQPRMNDAKARATVDAALAEIQRLKSVNQYDWAIRRYGDKKSTAWRGPITTREQADQVLRGTAYCLGLVGMTIVLINLARANLGWSTLLVVAFYGVFAAVIWNHKSTIAVWIMFGFVGLVGGVSVIATLFLAIGGAPIDWAGFLLKLMWLIPLAVLARAVQAVRARKRLPRQSVEEIFE